MAQTTILTFDVAIDGTMQNIKGDIDGYIPDNKLINRLLFAGNKLLIDEEVASLTVSTDKYLMKISASGANFSVVISKLN